VDNQRSESTGSYMQNSMSLEIELNLRELKYASSTIE